jgi:hypothetical protein
MNRIRLHLCALALTLGLLPATPALAMGGITAVGDPIALSSLLGGGSLAVDGLLFSMFSYSATGEMPDAEDVNVVPIMDDSGFYGVQFTGGFVDTSFSPGASDALLSFKVTKLEGPAITDVHLSGNPNLLGETLGTVSVTETIDFGPQIEIFDDSVLGTQLTDFAEFAPTRELSLVLKDILAFAIEGTATLSAINQTFSVPEPGTLAMLGMGLSGLLLLGRRR